MNPYVNEEVMWQRLKDIQMEAENRRLLAQSSVPAVADLLRLLVRRAWWIAGLAMRRPPRRSPLRVVEADHESASDAA
jgi:hypothetical protein